MLQEALADSQLQAVKAQLERRGLSINTDEAQAVQLAGGQQVLIPFGEDVHLVWTRTNGQTAAVGLIRQGNKTLNVSAEGQERVVRFLPQGKVQKLLRKLREKPKFQQFEGKLAQKGKRVGTVRVLFDETNQIAILGIANEGDEEKIVHQVRIKVKAGKDDEPEDDAEPAIQATSCGQASGEAVPAGAKMQPLAAPPGEEDIEGGYEGPQICTSQWGYDYLCISRTPAISLSTTSLTLPQTFINQQTQASFVIWNSGGGTLSGTVSVPAPFSIVSGSSFSLLPGQPQEVVVKFSSATAGSFSKSISISSNAGNATVTAIGIAHKVSFSPAQVDFGSGLLVLREQCNDMGVCGLHTEKVGLPIEKTLTVKNEGSVAVTLTLSTAAPYKIVSVLPTLSPGQSGQVTLRFDPNESGSFPGNVQVGINGGQGNVNSSPLVGVAHKIEIDPAELSFGLVFLGNSRTRTLTLKNQGVTTASLAVSTSTPYAIESASSFTLTPSQSQDVTVRFTPPNSDVFPGTIRLSVGSTAVEVPVVGRAMTREEYIQQAVATYNASVQQAGYGAMYVQDGNRGLALAGFPSLSADDVTGFLGMFDQLASPEEGEIPPEIARALEILSTIGEQQIEEWLWALVLAERAGQFEQEYERLLMLGFDRVVQALQLITGSSAIQAKADIHNFMRALAMTNANSWSEAIYIVLEQPDPGDPNFDIYDKAREIFLFAIRHGAWGPFIRYLPYIVPILSPLLVKIGGPLLPVAIGIILAFAPDQAARLLADAFYRKVREAEAAINGSKLPGEGPEAAKRFTENVKTIVRHLASRSAEDPDKIAELLFRLWFEVIEKDLLSPAFDYVRREALALINVAAVSIDSYGWDLVGIRREITGRDGRQYTIDLMLYKVGLEIGEGVVNTLSMINFYGCLGGHCTPERLWSVQNRIIGELNAIMTNFGSLLQEYGADFGIVGLVIVDPTTSTGDGGLQGVFNQIQSALTQLSPEAQKDAAIFLIWTDSTGQLWFACFGGGCSKMTDSQRRREACRMAGKRPGCGAKEWVIKYYVEGRDPPPPDDDDDSAEWTP